MNLGTRNPHHRRSALLQLAMCALVVLTSIPISALMGNGPWPSATLPADGKDQVALFLATWALTAVQLAFHWWASWRYLRAPSTSRGAFIISSLLALALYPLGTVIGLYSLWIVLFVPLVPEREAQLDSHEIT